MFKDYAHKYFEKGYIPIPLYKKKPIVKAWTTIKITEELLDEWCDRYPSAGIGILTGKTSGIIAIDIDKDQAIALTPQSPVSKRGRKGETRFFRYQGERSFKRHDIGIELLGDGNQTVVPPSIHPETKQPYVWLGDSLLDWDAEDLPVLDPAFIKSLDQNKTTELGTGRHNDLILLTGAKIGDGKDPTTIINELLEYDINNNIPSYFDEDGHKTKGYIAAVDMYHSVAMSAHRNGNYTPPLDDIVIDFTSKQKDYKKLPHLEGMGQVIFEDIYKNSPKPRTQFAFMATMSLLSATIGNKLYLAGTGANLYQYGVAPSGAGKDFPMKRAQEYINTCIMGEVIGTSSPTSESVILKMLEGNRERILFINEAESLLKKVTSDNNNHGLRECLTQVFEMSGSMMYPKTLMSSGKGVIGTNTLGHVFSPFLNIFMMSTIKAFSMHAKTDIINTGLGARFLYYFEDRKKIGKFVKTYRPPLNPKIIEAIQLMAGMGGTNMMMDLDASNEFIIQNALESKAALKMREEIHYAVQKESYGQFDEILNRRGMLINKFALIHHVMTHPDTYIQDHVEAKSYEWARVAIDAIHYNMRVHLEENTSESMYQGMVNDMKRLIRRYTEKGTGIDKSKIGNHLSKIPRKTRAALIEDLIEQKIIARDNDNLYWAV